MYRIGFSKDIHSLIEGRKLIISGVSVDYHKGEDAFSDGDVLYHAVSEAILGALAEGDLGTHFPNTENKNKNISSAIILKYVCDLMIKRNYRIVNVDTQVILEEPKLKPYILEMRQNLANLLNTDITNISIKAGTNEGNDATGRKEAIEVYASVLLKQLTKGGKEDN